MGGDGTHGAMIGRGAPKEMVSMTTDEEEMERGWMGYFVRDLGQERRGAVRRYEI